MQKRDNALQQIFFPLDAQILENGVKTLSALEKDNKSQPAAAGRPTAKKGSPGGRLPVQQAQILGYLIAFINESLEAAEKRLVCPHSHHHIGHRIQVSSKQLPEKLSEDLHQRWVALWGERRGGNWVAEAS